MSTHFALALKKLDQKPRKNAKYLRWSSARWNSGSAWPTT